MYKQTNKQKQQQQKKKKPKNQQPAGVDTEAFGVWNETVLSFVYLSLLLPRISVSYRSGSGRNSAYLFPFHLLYSFQDL